MKYLFTVILMLALHVGVNAEEVNAMHEPAQVESGKAKESIPYKRENIVDSSYIGKIVVVLVVLLSLVALVLFVLNKLGIGINVNARGDIASQRIKLLEVKRLSTKITVFYVEVDKTPLVLAQSGDSLLLINKKDWGLEVEERA